MSDFDFPLPPPTFEFLVFSLKTQTEVHLGLVPFGEESEKPNLPAARHSIDMLAMILEKTRGNLSMEEQRLIENSLTELRFRYVQVSGKSNSEPNAAGAANSSRSSPEAAKGESSQANNKSGAEGASAS